MSSVTSAASSWGPMAVPTSFLAFEGQAAAHLPQALHPLRHASAGDEGQLRGQALRQRPHPMQEAPWKAIRGSKDFPSRLWHQGQSRRHPLRKTTVRRPGPSSTQPFEISKIIPLSSIAYLPNSQRAMMSSWIERPRSVK